MSRRKLASPAAIRRRHAPERETSWRGAVHQLPESPLRGFFFCAVPDRLLRNIGAFFGTSIPLQCSFAMQLFSYNFTDLTTFDSPQKEFWLDEKDLPDFGKRTAREMLAAVPDLQHKGLCVGIYDDAGEPISYVPLDTLQ